MKKLCFISTILLILSFFAFSYNSYAGTAICEPDCPETPFLSQYPLTCEFQIGNCTFIADYYIRKACSTWCDIMLWRVRCIDPPPYNNYDVNQLIDIATASII